MNLSNFLLNRPVQAIAHVSKRLLDQAIASFSSDCFGAVCYIDVAAMSYNAVICSIMSWYDYHILFQMYGCPYNVIMSNNEIGTPNINRTLYLKTGGDELR